MDEADMTGGGALVWVACSLGLSLEARGQATVLKIVALKLASAAPNLVFETDATASESIEVLLVGRNGEVLDLPSLRHSTQIQRSPGELPSLDLAPLRLPKGRYRVEAKVGALKASETIFIGSQDEEFAAALERHQKAIAAQTQAEKRILFYTVRAHEKLAADLVFNFKRWKSEKKRWARYYEKWRRDLNAARKRTRSLIGRSRVPNTVAFPETVAGLKNKSDLLLSRAEELDRAVRGGREPAGVVPSEDIARDFSALKREAGQL